MRKLSTLGVLVVPGVLVGCAEAPAPPAQSASPPVPPQSVGREIVIDECVGETTTAPIRRAPPEFDDADADAIRLFYDVLAPYGTWADDTRLGVVWIPKTANVGASFVPYATHGRWSNRDAGGTPDWVWVSDLPWGWVTFHYGRWAYTGDRGWAWIAGRRYSGAWVDWRTPVNAPGSAPSASEVVGWGPTPPSRIWRVSPGLHESRARLWGAFDPREDYLVTMPYAAFATPYVYTHTRDLFAPDVSAKLLPATEALKVAYTTEPRASPAPERLGFKQSEVPAPPAMDRGLQQAWMLATPATASAIGAGPHLAAAPRLRTYVVGGPRYAVMNGGATR